MEKIECAEAVAAPENEGPAESSGESFSSTLFTIGDVYLFHPDDPRCPAAESLWGVFDKRTDGTIRLESSSRDLLHFRKWHLLSEEYRHCRCATRAELRDYMASLLWFESHSTPADRAADRRVPVVM